MTRVSIGILGHCLLGICWLVACSDDGAAPQDGGTGEASSPGEAGAEAAVDASGPPPKLIAGGGTSGGAIDGRINIYVVEYRTDKPLAGAFVMLGDGSEHKGTTDDDGLVSFSKPGLKGPVTLTAGIKGYTTSTLVGLDAANVTLPLEPRNEPTVETGTCTGTVKDWGTLASLPLNHYHVGFAGYLLDSDLSALRNDVEQPPGDLNLYLPGFPLYHTNWAVTVPAGDFAIYMLVFDWDTKGTLGQDDDTFALTHIGVAPGLKVGAGQKLADVEVPIVPVTGSLDVKLPAQPVGTDKLTVGISAQLTGGELVPVFYDTTSQTSFPVPTLDGAFAGGNFWVSVEAEKTAATDDDRKTTSLLIKRGLTDMSKSVEGTLLDLPSDLKLEGRKLSYLPVAGANVNTIRLLPETSGSSYWNISFVAPASSTVSYTLPTLPPAAEPLPADKLFFLALCSEFPGVDLNNVLFDELGDKLARYSQDGIVVTLK